MFKNIQLNAFKSKSLAAIAQQKETQKSSS